MIKKFFSASAIVLLHLAVPVSANPIIVPAPPALSAEAYMLIDAATGKVLVEEKADVQLPPASLTVKASCSLQALPK